jgi:hypothetical protein
MRGDADYFERACAKLSTVQSLRNVRTSSISGSIVFEYAGSFEQISWLGRRHRLFRVEALTPPRKVGTQTLPRHWLVRGPYSGSPMENLHNAITAARLEHPLLAATLGGLGAYQLWRADPLATALNMLFVLVNGGPHAGGTKEEASGLAAFGGAVVAG